MRSVRLLTCLLFMAPALACAEEGFYLKDGDRVVFYGDSITEQRLYTTFVETFVITRFPKMGVSFVHSGWGGDRVTGGGGGPIDRRLKRDVFAYKPTVMTIMLGMNDASYRPFDQKIFDTYAQGYKHIVDEVKARIPGIRMTLIRPSPFDDVTRPPLFDGGYNSVLSRYGDFVRDLASEEGVDLADLNSSVVAATRKAHESDPDNAKKLNPDRVHPGPAGQLLMAAALLDAWHAPATVTSVTLMASSDKDRIELKQKNTKVDWPNWEDKALIWTQTDEALPFPIDLKDPVVALAVKSSDMVERLNQQILKVGGLEADNYLLKIDGDEVGTFSKQQLREGINLAVLATPMVKQAAKVHQLTIAHNDLHYARWRKYEVPFAKSPHLPEALEGLDALEADLVKEQREAARPTPHRYELRPKS